MKRINSGISELMLRKHLPVILALAGCLGCATALGGGYYYLERYERQPYAQEAYQPARDAHSATNVKKNIATSTVYEPYCKHPTDREDSDLCAQWGAVQATSEANRLSRISLRVTYLEFAALIISLMFTGWAALAASKAARVAEEATRGADKGLVIAEQNRVISERAMLDARLMGEVQARAYVVTQHPKWRDHPNPNKIMASLEVKNSGNTPAHDFHWELQLLPIYSYQHPISVEDIVYENLPEVSQMGQRSSSLIAPSDVYENNVEVDSRFDGALIESGNLIYLLRGWVKYKDIFGSERECQFCYHFAKVALEKGMGFCTSPFGNMIN